MNVLEASGLGKRYGRTWALRMCWPTWSGWPLPILLARGQVQLAGEVAGLLAAHRLESLEELALGYLRENPAEVTR